MKKRILFWVAFLAIDLAVVNAQNVSIPDANFKAELVGNSSINTNGDTEIQVSEAQAFSGAMDVSYKSIADLTGIEAFVAITELNCSGNSLTSLNVAANTALQVLDCSTNQLTAIDVSTNTALKELYVKNNFNLASLDVSTNTGLETLHCYNNDLSTLDVSTNTSLRRLYCFGNNLTTLDVSSNVALFSLHCNSNDLTTLNLAPGNSLGTLRCEWNELTALDLSGTGVRSLSCQGNQLTSLNIQNGKNHFMNNNDFEAAYNPNLTCVQVDDVNYSSSNWMQIDTGLTFSTNCTVTSINELPTLENLVLSPNPATSTVALSYRNGNAATIENQGYEIELKVLDISGREFLSSNQPRLDVSGLPTGVYLVKIQAGPQSLTKKLVVL